MDYSVFSDINNYFSDRDYEIIPTDSLNVKMYGSYRKSSLYLVNIILLNDEYRFDKELFERYKDITRKQFKDSYADKVILLNLMLLENVNRIYDDINYCPETEDDFIDINWIVDTKNKELVIPDKQINNVIGLEKSIKRVIGDEEIVIVHLEKKKRISYLTYMIILINILIWGFMEYKGSTLNADTLIAFGAYYSGSIIYYREYWRLFTSMFIHIGIAHLAFNCFALYIFGGRLEKYLTSLQFLLVYFVSGLLGGALSIVINWMIKNTVISAGASGAIYGLVGGVFIYSKLTDRTIEGLNAYIIGIYLLMGLVVSSVTGSISMSAHLGGFVGGILVTLTVVSFKKLPKNENKSENKSGEVL